MALSNKNMQTNDLLNYYLTMNMNNICRVCLEKSTNKLIPIFDPIKPPHFSVLMMACASVQVQEGDGLPPYICQKCVSRLNIAFQFKTECESSDTKLRQCFENFNLPHTPDLTGFLEVKREGVKYQTQNIASEGAQTQTERQSDVHCIQETNIQNVVEICDQICEDNVDLSIVPDEAEGKKEYENKVNVAEFKIELEGDFANQESTVKLDDIGMSNVTHCSQKSRRGRKGIKHHQCDTCGKIFRTKPSLVHHIRIHTGERPYVCHLCDKRFVNGGHLHTHMRTHTGEKNHICSACNKAFATTQQLTKHTIAIHTSERPYGCTYCPKRFASSSNLNTHIKIHTGEKNYHCEVCGKPFSTKGQLYQHGLVHTGEKAFLCEFCNKRFSQKAHLVRHIKTHNRTE